DLILDFKNADRSGAAGDGLCQSGDIGVAPPELQNRKSFRRDSILDRRTIVQPNVRKPRARPRGRFVFAEPMLGTAWNVADDRRIDVAVTELGADHLVALALFNVGNRRQR